MHKKIQVENVYHKFSNFPLFLNLEMRYFHSLFMPEYTFLEY